MKSYNIVQALWLSFYSADFYRAVAQRWRGIGFWYLFLLVVITTLPLGIRFVMQAAKVTPEMLAPFTSKVPTIDIKNGEATVHGPQPLHITDPETGKTVVILDTTGKPVPLEQHQHVIVLLKDRLVVKQPNKTQEIPLRDLQPLIGNPAHIDRQWVEGVLLWWVDLFRVMFTPIAVLVAFTYRFIELLVLGVIGLLFASGRSPSLSYAQSLRLSAMALTPVIIVNTIYEAVAPAHGFVCVWWIICLAMPIYFLHFGVRSAYAGPPPLDIVVEPNAPRDDDEEFYERRRDEVP